MNFRQEGMRRKKPKKPNGLSCFPFDALAVPGLRLPFLFTFAIGNRVGSLSIGGGAKIGAIVGFLLWFTADFILYGVTNIANLTRTVVDPLLEIIHGGIGVVIAAVLGRVPASGRNPT